MFKRVIWMSIGAAAGSAGTMWTQRKVREQMDRVRPAAVVERARSGVGEVRGTVAAAIEEGRSTMRETEREMRRGVTERFGRDTATRSRR